MKRWQSKQLDVFCQHNGRVYVSLDAIVDASAYPVIKAPFFGAFVLCTVRELTHAQIAACGRFSLIETTMDKIAKQRQISTQEMYDYSELQHKIIKRALICPTYDQIMEAAGARINSTQIEADIESLAHDAAMLSGQEKAEAEKEIMNLRMWSRFILPSEFTATIVSHALGVDSSDIKEVTAEALLDAALAAEKGHDNPADHIGGMFTDFNRDDINTRAWIELSKHRAAKGDNGVRRR